jgi:hypothetical protein
MIIGLSGPSPDDDKMLRHLTEPMSVRDFSALLDQASEGEIFTYEEFQRAACAYRMQRQLSIREWADEVIALARRMRPTQIVEKH